MEKSAGRVLIGDSSSTTTERLKNTLVQQDFEVLVASDGEESLRLIEQYQPQLVFLDLMLPRVHGIDILKRLKQDPTTQDVGVIISTTRALVQDYQAAIQNGADYYLLQPYDQQAALSLVQNFFKGGLKPDPFVEPFKGCLDPSLCYEPEIHAPTSFLKFWGTRGSVPVAGLDYYRYGGNTACLEVRSGHEIIIIDAGSGIRSLGYQLMENPIEDIHLFIGHSHWDHIMGFPFFAPVYSPQFNIHIYAARGFRKSIEELFTGMLDHDYFPVRLDEMQANFFFHDLQEIPSVIIGDVKIDYTFASHPGSTLCFKIGYNNKTIGYATDNEMLIGYHGHPNEIHESHPLLENYRSLVEFFKGCDTLIHEAQYLPKDYQNKVGWGHSSISNAAVLVKHSGAKEWIVTHHDPAHTDSILLQKLQLQQQVIRDCNIQGRVHMAYDGYVMPI